MSRFRGAFNPATAKLKHALLAQGLTDKPVCPGCGQKRDPKAFGKDGKCIGCPGDAQTTKGAA